ncbi:DUF4270 domain-containing protein [Flavobacterium sp. 7A]|uniref:DUF4270 domain-containing protein n=1 Tax=Flavobacterium sp. 7A TaxID=2940571 RepID=UPI002226EF98|nr:DUF4270 domain-containing protein [Flavobacterium sp. 7A]MCW2120342.1 hypothetical protein [Flavobacterium sp. 7A]
MYNNSFFKKVLLICSVVLLCSCDKDYNSIGSDIIGGNHFDFEVHTSDVVAYNQMITAVQSNDQEVNPFGIYDNPDFGTTTANFVTQVSLATVSPVLLDDPKVQSVVLTIPYFIDNTQTVTTAEGVRTYALDSIYGDPNGKLKLSVFRSGYFLRNLDPIDNFVNTQRYYTDQNSLFSNAKIGVRLNDATDPAQNDAFFFDKTGSVVPAVANVSAVVYTAPQMQLTLNKDFFQSVIIDAVASGKLINNDVFTEYFKGLYFQAERSGSSPTNLSMLDFASGKITINYIDGVDAARDEVKTMVLNLIGHKVSLLEQSNTKADYATATSSGNINTVDGDSKLYLKGGEGSMAIVKLFQKEDLTTIKNNGWLVNEANLIFHVDPNSVSVATNAQPQRLYLYDLDNNNFIEDFRAQSPVDNTKFGRLVYGGILTKDSDGGYYYKFRITNHVRNLISNDSTNVKLGLVVSEDITLATNAYLKTSGNISRVPQASVMNPLGTVLYGGTADVADKNKLKLEIYYTKPN